MISIAIGYRSSGVGVGDSISVLQSGHGQRPSDLLTVVSIKAEMQIMHIETQRHNVSNAVRHYSNYLL